MPVDYSPVTESPGRGTTPEGLKMLATRYNLAADLAAGRDVLEVAAGACIGLGLVARKARRVVGTDITPQLLRAGRQTYGARANVATADGQDLPFRDSSFDVVLLYEAIYYLPDVDRFFREARRVLRPNGLLVICTANKKRPGFVRSPHSRSYYGAQELQALYERNDFARPELSVAFPAEPPSTMGRLLLWGFSLADRLHLVPRSLEGRAKVKRLLYGDLIPTPPELMEAHGGAKRQPFELHDAVRWKVLYAVGARSATSPEGMVEEEP